MFKRILVPIDLSEPSDAALEYARAMATRYGASLHLLHVAEDPYRVYSGEVYLPEAEGLRDVIVADATRKLIARLQPSDIEQLGATTDAVIGTPAGSIVEYAAGRDMDLIVMGTHGRDGMAHLLTGSVAERVIRTASVPVLTVRRAARTAAAHAA
jgi:nucleotide-binding universal stress UspA family protein